MTSKKSRKFLWKKFFGKTFFLGRGYPLKKSENFWGKNFWKRVPPGEFRFFGKNLERATVRALFGVYPQGGEGGGLPPGAYPRNRPVKAIEMPYNRRKYAG